MFNHPTETCTIDIEFRIGKHFSKIKSEQMVHLIKFLLLKNAFGICDHFNRIEIKTVFFRLLPPSNLSIAQLFTIFVQYFLLCQRYLHNSWQSITSLYTDIEHTQLFTPHLQPFIHYIIPYIKYIMLILVLYPHMQYARI